MHVDKGNLGPSAFVGIGDYTGGGLWVHGKGMMDAKQQWHVYDGNDAHKTVPFKGPGARYTFVFFTVKLYKKVPQSEVKFLRDSIGFPWPKAGLRAKEYPPGKERVAKGLKAYQQWKKENNPPVYGEDEVGESNGLGTWYTGPDWARRHGNKRSKPKKRPRAKRAAATFPFSIGTKIAKRFGDEVFRGQIDKLYPNAPRLCHVTYEDGDHEDLGVRECRKAVRLYLQK